MTMPNLDLLPADIRESTRAVVWKREMRDNRPTKVPYVARRPRQRAAVDDPKTGVRSLLPSMRSSMAKLTASALF